LNPGKKIHQLVEVLLRDFYSPLKLGGLFRELFPGEYFDPDSSPGRVHQLIWRARRWLESSDIPVEISENEGEYRLKINGQFSFRVPYERAGIDSIQVLYGRLKNEIGTDRSFAASDACRALGLSRSGFKAFAARAVARGLLSRVGTHSRTRYSFDRATHSAA
jgi:hypothetical protein